MKTQSTTGEESIETPRILVVDDTPENLQIAGETLSQSLDCDLAFALSGQQALDVVEASLPDLILLDIMMPGMDGLAVCRALKANPRTASIPILFLTARADVGDVVTGFAAGAVDYITKPFNACELVARVQTHLDLARANQTICRQNDDLRQLLHILCHDLATPIGGIVSLLEITQEPDDWRAMLTDLSRASQNALDLIDLVRQMRALEEGKKQLKLVPVGLAAVCRDAELAVSGKLREKQVALRLEVDDSLYVLAEPVALTHSVLCNLLTNAIKFSSPGGTVFIEAQPDKEDSVCLRVRDSGIGMPHELQASLFDPACFTTRPGTSGEIGTGFGMILVKKFVEAFGGRIEVASRSEEDFPDDHGTDITMHLHVSVW